MSVIPIGGETRAGEAVDLREYEKLRISQATMQKENELFDLIMRQNSTVDDIIRRMIQEDMKVDIFRQDNIDDFVDDTKEHIMRIFVKGC